MATRKTSEEIHCDNDCRMAGCPGHKAELQIQTTSDWFTYSKDGKVVFGMDTNEMRNLLSMIEDLDYL